MVIDEFDIDLRVGELVAKPTEPDPTKRWGDPPTTDWWGDPPGTRPRGIAGHVGIPTTQHCVIPTGTSYPVATPSGAGTTGR